MQDETKAGSELSGGLGLEDYKALADSYLEELESAKEASGYNAYLETRKKDGHTLHHWTLNGYLRNLRHRAEKP